MTQRELFTVRSTDKHYISPIVGNGEVVTMLGSTGYHNGLCPDRDRPNHQIFWAARRLDTPTHALVRFGQLNRTLSINGAATSDDVWTQTLDYDRGMLLTTLEHGPIREQTRSLVCLSNNLLIFHTRLENMGEESADLTFALDYAFGEVDPALYFPYMSHFDFRPGYETPPDGQAPLHLRVRPQEDGSLSVLYQAGEQLGEVRLGWLPGGDVVETERGGTVTHRMALAAGEATDLWFWVMLSDRRKFTHFPQHDRVLKLLDEHERAWADFWAASRIELGDEQLEGLLQSSLYAIRCSASPWSVPPAYLATYWEGRTFHDELYPFLALLASNHRSLAARIPAFRAHTLPVAVAWGGDRGARFPWETLEDGREGGPYGHWMDERFHIAQFSETAWQYYLYTRDVEALRRFYPLLRACAELFVCDVLVRDENGVLKTRLVTDFDEHTYPLSNGIFTICAAVRSLENAAQAATLLGLEVQERALWRGLAVELRPALPTDDAGLYYRVSDDATHWHIAQAGMVFPFRVDPESDRARETLTRLADALSTDLHTSAGNTDGYTHTHWIWSTAILATGLFMQGRAEEGYDLLRRTPLTAGPFHAPNEHFRSDETATLAGGSRLPWFTTASGAFVYALHAMFVYVDSGGAVLLRGLPASLPQVRFERLLAADEVLVSGEVRDGQLVSLSAFSPRAMTWTCRLPQRVAQAARLSSAVQQVSATETDLAILTCALQEGETQLV